MYFLFFAKILMIDGWHVRKVETHTRPLFAASHFVNQMCEHAKWKGNTQFVARASALTRHQDFILDMQSG